MKVSRLLLTAAAFVFASGLWMPTLLRAGETDTGSIDGRVFDETKAALPGATVTVKNTATGLTRSTISSAAGTFHIGSVPAGHYDVTIELTGFAPVVHKDVPVQVASQSTVDATLKVGTVTETITVSGEASLIQTTKSDVGQVINSTLV